MRRRFLVVITIALTVVVGGHYYIAQRLIFDAGLPGPWAGLASGVLLLSAYLALSTRRSRRLAGKRYAKPLIWWGTLWMGMFFYLVMAAAASDLALWALGMNGPQTAQAQAMGLAGVTLLAVLFGLPGGLRTPRVKRVEVTLDRLAPALDGLRIVQLSDVHIGPLLDRRFCQRVVDRCNELRADAIVVTGDLVDGSVRDLADDVAPLAELSARHGVFFVTGNHDHYANADEWTAKLRELGMRVLTNERVRIERGSAGLELAGVPDVTGRGHFREDLDRTLAGRPSDDPVVLLAHNPRTFGRARRRDVDLQLSGHTHGGQLWPWRYFVRLQTRYIAGLYRRGGSQLYVSCGTGFWGPPLRLFAPAEITEIVLRSPRAHQPAFWPADTSGGQRSAAAEVVAQSEPAGK